MEIPEELSQRIVSSVRGLGDRARQTQGGSLHTRIKEDGTSVTSVDREVEMELRRLLLGLFPSHSVMGEEGGMTGAEGSSLVWVIDPIDGTTNYRFGLPIWAISVGLLEYGCPVWGCVHLPGLDRLFLAQRGKGATCNGKPIKALARTHLHREDILGITSEGVKDWEFPVPPKIRALGSAAAQASFVAAGQYVGYFVDRWHIWDLAAALLIAKEAGVKVTDRRGKELVRFSQLGPQEGPPILFASEGVHGQLMALIHPKPHWRGKEYLD